MKAEQVARVCHEANRAYCEAIGDHSQVRWEDAPTWQRQSAITGVEFAFKAKKETGKAPSPSEMHESWRRDKAKDGWKYGPVKDAEKKEHPCFVPYDQLPPQQHAKDFLFKAVVEALYNF
jgi:hypothetical protein